jgi:NAD(P)-dependent dehydrogenase (short-subunit alcohol dehydrogenase family)
MTDRADAVAVVVGAGGAIGAALVGELCSDSRYAKVLAFARRPRDLPSGSAEVGYLDLDDEASIEAAASRAAAAGSVRLVICATGLLHDATMNPEKQWSAIRAESMARAFAVNATGPALVARAFLPRLPRSGRSVFAALSARVGSIEDNRRGGWYAYRASKAALNMLIKTFAIELARRAPEALCVGLHPGTVDSALSRPFQAGLPATQLFSPAQAAGELLRVLDGLGAADSGGVYAWDGARVPA